MKNISNIPKIIQRYCMIGSNRKVRSVCEIVDSIADADITVLIQGETGTGKEVVARGIYQRSLRKDKPFITINCSAIAENLIESELFGHVKGSFTGSINDKTGKFEQADKGTIFLDEIGELPLHLQPKLLRVLQEMEIEPVGGSERKMIDVRVIAATNRNLSEEIKKGNFREDLYFRLNVIPLYLPSLRERKEDIESFSNFFIQKYNDKHKRKIEGIESSALETLFSHHWPGNIRELENTIERAVALRSQGKIKVEDLLLFTCVKTEITASQNNQKTQSYDSSWENLSLKEIEREVILKILKKYDGNRNDTAKHLGISVRKLIYKIKEYEDQIK